MMKKKEEEKPIEVEKVFKEIKELRKPWKWYDHVWWLIRYGIWNKITDLRWQIPNTIDRAKRGWGNADTWGFCDYLSDVICGGLKHLKKNKHGIPATINPKTGELGHDEKRWDEILDKMIYTFEIAKKILNNYPGSDWLYIPTKEWDEKKDLRDKFGDGLMKVMTKEECLAYEEGWRLFAEHFFSLWD